MKLLGMDIGGTKTGLTLFEMKKGGDQLVVARTVVANVLPVRGTEAKRRKRARKSGKEIKKRSSAAEVSVIHSDVARCSDLVNGIHEFVVEHQPSGIFIEMPSGGGKDARAHRLMGGATYMITAILTYEDLPFEMFSPTDVEKSIGIYVSSKEVKARGLSTYQAQRWKKERLREVVLKEWPLFNGWPSTEGIAEDAYDSAAAFMCGRNANKLYARLRSEFDGRRS